MFDEALLDVVAVLEKYDQKRGNAFSFSLTLAYSPFLSGTRSSRALSLSLSLLTLSIRFR
jgi:hypothetical protein